jgi:predicted RNA binding protein YcfA (HicA-like mRNA interferase family)
MKRKDLIKYLEKNGCKLLREGGNHTIYINSVTQKVSAIPRHREIEVVGLIIVFLTKFLSLLNY